MTEDIVLNSGLLQEFVDWGLFEGRRVEIYPAIYKITDVRIAPLYNRVLKFSI